MRLNLVDVIKAGHKKTFFLNLVDIIEACHTELCPLTIRLRPAQPLQSSSSTSPSSSPSSSLSSLSSTLSSPLSSALSLQASQFSIGIHQQHHHYLGVHEQSNSRELLFSFQLISSQFLCQFLGGKIIIIIASIIMIMLLNSMIIMIILIILIRILIRMILIMSIIIIPIMMMESLTSDLWRPRISAFVDRLPLPSLPHLQHLNV